MNTKLLTEIKESFESDVFQDFAHKEFLAAWLQANIDAEVLFVSRDDFNNKWKAFIFQNAGIEGKNAYIIYIPEDLKVFELTELLKSIELIWQSQLKELENVLSSLKASVYSLLRKSWWKEENFENHLSESWFSKRLITDVRWQKIKNTIATRKILKAAKWKEWVDSIKSIVTANIENITNSIESTIFNNSKAELYSNMKTFSREDFANFSERLENWELTSDVFSLHVESENDLLEIELKLRHVLRIHMVKDDLQKLRQSGENDRLNHIQNVFCEILLHQLYEYPWTATVNHSQPTKILKEKEFSCVGSSLLAHIFLEELDIRHDWLNIPGHSALCIYIWDDEYYFDPVNRIFEKFNKLNLETIWDIYKAYWMKYPRLSFKKYPADKLVLMQLLTNMAWDLAKKWDLDTALVSINKALLIDPNSFASLCMKGNIVSLMWNEDEALLFFEKSLKANPLNDNAYENIVSLHLRSWNNREAFNFFQKWIKIFPENKKLWEKYQVILVYLNLKDETFSDLAYLIDIFDKRWFIDKVKTLFSKRKKKIYTAIENKDYETLLQIFAMREI